MKKPSNLFILVTRKTKNKHKSSFNFKRKMKFYLKYILIFSSLFFYSCLLPKQSSTSTDSPKTTEEKTPNINLAFSKPMSISHKVLDSGEDLSIILELEVPRLEEIKSAKAIVNDFSFVYKMVKSYTNGETIETKVVKIDDKPLFYENGKYYVSFVVPKKNTISELMLLEITDKKSGQRKIQDIPLTYAITKTREKFSIYDKNGKVPIFNNFILQKDSIQIRDLKNTSQNFFVKHFSHDFAFANPPMVITNKLPKKNLEVDTSFTITSNSIIHFEKTGLYFIQEDTSQYYGLSVYVGDRKFPKLTRIVDLIDPLVYITSKKEIDSLKIGDDYKKVKKSMDKFWIKLLSGNTRVAKNTIKTYYKRVKSANELFTTYKEGWKTDMGMIYIIFGSPNRVVRTNDKEMWTYTQNSSFQEISFTFVRKPNQFTDYHYNLLRFQDYEDVWYPTLELWRAGKVY